MTTWISTSKQQELGDSFGFSPASVEWIAETVENPTESAVTDRLIQEIVLQFGEEVRQEAEDLAKELGLR